MKFRTLAAVLSSLIVMGAVQSQANINYKCVVHMTEEASSDGVNVVIMKSIALVRVGEKQPVWISEEYSWEQVIYGKAVRSRYDESKRTAAFKTCMDKAFALDRKP